MWQVKEFVRLTDPFRVGVVAFLDPSLFVTFGLPTTDGAAAPAAARILTH